MHNFEPSIAAWRARLTQAMPRQDETIDELEEHLREQIDAAVRQGRPPEEAFAAAVQAIGDARTLAAEFARAQAKGRATPKTIWGAYGVTALVAIGPIVHLVTGYWEGRFGLMFVAHVITIFTGYLTVLGMGTLGAGALVTAWWWPLSDEWSEAAGQAMRNFAVTGAALVGVGTALGMAWSAQNRGRWWSWSAPEWGALAILGWLVLTLLTQRRRPQDRRLHWKLAAIGNAVVAVGWFCAQTVGGGGPISGWWWVFAASQLIIAALPAGVRWTRWNRVT